MSFHGTSSGPIGDTARMEKAEMQDLNNKLAAYMDKMRHLKQQGPALDPAKYQAAMRSLEDELMKLKNMYENELAKLRRQLEEANRARHAGDQAKGAVNDLQNKLGDAHGRNKKLQDDMNNLQRHLLEKEKENADLKAKLANACAELDQLRAMARDYEDLKRKLDQEQNRRRAAEDRVKQLEDKCGFDTQRLAQENKDLKDRLQKANDIIQTLEKKVKDMSKGSGDEMAKMVQQMRDANAADMRKFQKETEDALGKNLKELKDQIERDASEKERLKRENAMLQEKVRQLQGRLGEMDGQNQGLRAQNGALQKELDNEKAATNARIKELERRIRELQDMLMERTKEFNEARDIQASLRQEIDTYRRLLEGESARPGTNASGRGRTPNIDASQAPVKSHNAPNSALAMKRAETTYRDSYNNLPFIKKQQGYNRGTLASGRGGRYT